MEKQNYSLILEKTINENEKAGLRPTLLLHACCAPCSSYVLEYLSKYFDITLLFYNPNISPEEEYNFRAAELKRLIGEMPLPSGISIITEKYDPREFYDMAKGLEEFPEGGERCKKCYRLRLSRTAKIASEQNFDYFTTTLSISPHKNAATTFTDPLTRGCARMATIGLIEIDSTFPSTKGSETKTGSTPGSEVAGE